MFTKEQFIKIPKTQIAVLDNWSRINREKLDFMCHLASVKQSKEGMVDLMVRSLPTTLLIDIYFNQQEGSIGEGPWRLGLIGGGEGGALAVEGPRRSGIIWKGSGRCCMSLRRVQEGLLPTERVP